MLKECPECQLQVSDKAITCPHCGYPLKPDAPKRISKKRMRLPNGFGQISEIKNANLRKPFRAMISVGKDEIGRPICKLLKPTSYFETYKEAYEALLEYNKDPYSADASMTLKELHDQWVIKYSERVEPVTFRKVMAIWNQCEKLYDCSVNQLRAHHIRELLDTKDSPNTRIRIRELFASMLDYAVENDIVDKNVARNVNVQKELQERVDIRKSHISFSDDEINALWKNVGDPIVNMILVQCYSGWRPTELCSIRLDDVNFDNWSVTGGSKTESGRNRTVPIHEKIRGLVKEAYEFSSGEKSDYLFSRLHGSYDSYKAKFKKVIEDLGLNKNHSPHDCRVQFVTMCKKYHVDEYAIKRMVGHKITDITEGIYTKRDISWLHSEISKIM